MNDWFKLMTLALVLLSGSGAQTYFLATHLGSRIDRLDARIGQLDARIDRLDTRIDQLDARIDRLDQRLTAELADVRERLARVETRLAIPAAADTAVLMSATPADGPDS